MRTIEFRSSIPWHATNRASYLTSEVFMFDYFEDLGAICAGAL
jgi:hypothetical protein